MISPTVLALLCCPETHQPLTEADRKLVEMINQKIAAGQLKNRAGQPVTQPLDEGLVRFDQQVLYPVRQNIPVLLAEEAISLAQILVS